MFLRGVLLGCLLCIPNLSHGNVEENAWRAAYECSLRCDRIGSRNALLKLSEYHRFKLLVGGQARVFVEKELQKLNRSATKVVEPKTIDFVSVKKARHQKVGSKKNHDAFLETENLAFDGKQTELDVLRKAESAYAYGRLEEAKKLYQMALAVNPESAAAKEGLEHLRVEME